MSKKSAIAATSLSTFVQRADGLLTEALRRIYASHVERVQMRLAPIKLPSLGAAQLFTRSLRN